MTEHVLQSAHSAADRVMLISASLLSIVCIAVGAAYGDLLVSLMVGVPAAVVPLLIHRLAPGALVTRLACASAFMVLAALLIQLTGGLIEQPWGDICDGAEKRRTLLEVASLLGIRPDQCIAVGDGSNDIPMMQVAGLSVAYHAKPRVRNEAKVSITEGGLDRLLEVLR